MYAKPPNPAELAVFGFKPEEIEKKAYIWPENWPTFLLFLQCQTQWRTGMSGAIGLDYTVVFRLLDNRGLNQHEWDVAFGDIQAMEVAALEQMADDRED